MIVRAENLNGNAYEAQNVSGTTFLFMVGDMITDIQSGHALGMTTVYVGEKDVPNRIRLWNY